MAGWWLISLIGQLSKTFIVEFCVEAHRFWIGRVQPGTMTTKAAGALLSLGHETSAQTAMTKGLGDPECLDQEPSVRGMRRQTADEATLRVLRRQHETDVSVLRQGRPQSVQQLIFDIDANIRIAVLNRDVVIQPAHRLMKGKSRPVVNGLRLKKIGLGRSMLSYSC